MMGIEGIDILKGDQLVVEIALDRLENMEEEAFNDWMKQVGLDPSRKIEWADNRKANTRIFTQNVYEKEKEEERDKLDRRYRRSARRRN